MLSIEFTKDELKAIAIILTACKFSIELGKVSGQRADSVIDKIKRHLRIIKMMTSTTLIVSFGIYLYLLQFYAY